MNEWILFKGNRLKPRITGVVFVPEVKRQRSVILYLDWCKPVIDNFYGLISFLISNQQL